MGRSDTRRSALLALAAATLAGLGVYGGCSIYDSSLLLPAPEGGVDAEAGPDAPVDPCPHAGAPARPTKDDSTASNEYVTAIRTLDMGLTKDGGPLPTLSFDLDGICTCPGPESCKARVLNAEHCDDDAGRDNSGGELVRRFAQISGGLLDQDTINERIDEGTYGMIVRIRNYNGQLNDTEIELAVFISNGTPLAADGGDQRPKWDGNDRWILDSASVFGGVSDSGAPVIPNYVDTKAYVVNGVMVASLDFPLSLGGGSSNGTITLELTGSIITADLKAERGSFRMENGQISGRWSVQRLLKSLAALKDPFGSFVCPGSQTYENVKLMICKAADITIDPRAAAGSPCDALSIGFGFTGYPARIGPVEKVPFEQPNCPDAGLDDCVP